MCGIIGCNGTVAATPFLLEGLERLEYRGYDSAGIAVTENGKTDIEKKKGRISALAQALKRRPEMTGTIGIGHTRWATHGEPSDSNAHPHKSGRFTLVHNGIIENYAELKEKYLQLCSFESQTDTEVIAQLLNRLYSGNCLETIARTAALLKGSFALAILCEDEPEKIFCVRMSSPLLIALGDGAFIASDISAIGDKAKTLYRMADGEIASVGKTSVEFFDFKLNPIDKKPSEFEQSFSGTDKGNCEHFMLKEIYEEPEAVRRTVESGSITPAFDLDKPPRIYIVACGSAYHVGLAAKIFFEELLQIPTEVDIASEFRYRRPLVGSQTPVIIISQSGETADSLAALREAKARGARTISIVNVRESTIALESDFVFYTRAGTEIAVATTKAYSAQLAAIYKIGLEFAEKWHTADSETIGLLREQLSSLHTVLSECMNTEAQVKDLATQLSSLEHAYFIGRAQGYAAAAEASLKLKEISYIHSEAYAAGEMKHGTISLIEKGTTVFALCVQGQLLPKMQSNIDEVRTRGARVIAVSFSPQIKADEVIALPAVHPMFAVSALVVPMQLLGYYTAAVRGCDIDKPRNLAKSVTVE